jgi:hypothetical protein
MHFLIAARIRVKRFGKLLFTPLIKHPNLNHAIQYVIMMAPETGSTYSELFPCFMRYHPAALDQMGITYRSLLGHPVVL